MLNPVLFGCTYLIYFVTCYFNNITGMTLLRVSTAWTSMSSWNDQAIALGVAAGASPASESNTESPRRIPWSGFKLSTRVLSWTRHPTSEHDVWARDLRGFVGFIYFVKSFVEFHQQTQCFYFDILYFTLGWSFLVVFLLQVDCQFALDILMNVATTLALLSYGFVCYCLFLTFDWLFYLPTIITKYHYIIMKIQRVNCVKNYHLYTVIK